MTHHTPTLALRPSVCRMRVLLELLQRPRTVAECVRLGDYDGEFESRRRLFYRDVNELRALGFAIETDGGCPRRYVLKGWTL